MVSLSEFTRLKVSGLGGERADTAARKLVEQGAIALMSFGTAAGLVRDLRSGDLVLPSHIVAADGTRYIVDAQWRHRVCTVLNHDPRDCTIVEVIEPVCLVEEKSRLAAHTDAVAADMESAAIIRVAEECGIASLVVRVVVDPLSMTLPSSAIAAVSPTGARCWSGLCWGLLRKPHEIFEIYHLALASSLARRSLMEVCRSAGSEFCAFQ